MAPLLAQETRASRIIHVVVDDPMNRVVTGLSRQDFAVTEDGAPIAITAFSDGNSPISLAIVSQSIPAAVMMLSRSGDEIIQAQSVAGALQALAASKNSRKALIFTSGTIVGGIPSEIQVLKSGPENLMKTVLEARNSYSIWFSSSHSVSAVEVNLRPPAGLPPLTVSAK
ncbi:MAG TPA: hypothetical protein VML19_07165 [Verrucomicrobiae bacterium]|nr:hypothetical protein [Verrucomicrobiae bacterium]